MAASLPLDQPGNLVSYLFELRVRYARVGSAYSPLYNGLEIPRQCVGLLGAPVLFGWRYLDRSPGDLHSCIARQWHNQNEAEPLMEYFPTSDHDARPLLIRLAGLGKCIAPINDDDAARRHP